MFGDRVRLSTLLAAATVASPLSSLTHAKEAKRKREREKK